MVDKMTESVREISQVTIEYNDGSQETISGGFIIVVTDNPQEGKWNLQMSEETELDKILDFAYDAVDTFEMAKMEEHMPTKKKSHLTLVKG